VQPPEPNANGTCPGLLATIGTVESGRTDASSLHRRAWPWSINAEGWSYAAASKTDAMSAVRVLQARGIRLIDVGTEQWIERPNRSTRNASSQNRTERT
jgi:hypothetical protein